MAGDAIPADEADQLVRVCRTAMGDTLRSVTYFTRDDYAQVYLREDLEPDADIEGFIDHEWNSYEVTRDAYRASELGDYRYTIRVFENGYLVRVTTEDEGVLVTVDDLTTGRFEEITAAIAGLLGGA